MKWISLFSSKQQKRSKREEQGCSYLEEEEVEHESKRRQPASATGQHVRRQSMDQYFEARSARTWCDFSSMETTTTENLHVFKAGMTTLINSKYIVVKHLGTGSYGLVKLAFNLLDKKLYAIKACKKSQLGCPSRSSAAMRRGGRGGCTRLRRGNHQGFGLRLGAMGDSMSGGLQPMQQQQLGGCPALASHPALGMQPGGFLHAAFSLPLPAGSPDASRPHSGAGTPDAVVHRQQQPQPLAFGGAAQRSSSGEPQPAAAGGFLSELAGAVAEVAQQNAAAAAVRAAVGPGPGSSMFVLQEAFEQYKAENFVREIAIMKKLGHPNIVKLVEVIDDPASDNLLLVMEYVEGNSLQPRQINSLTWEPVMEMEVWRRARDVLLGLEYLHSHEVVHGDLKPANLIMDINTLKVKIVDFGSAVLHSRQPGTHPAALMASMMGPGTMACTPAFRSPESLQPGYRLSFELDMWALGITLFLWAFGQLPFNGAAPFMVYEAIRKQPVLVPTHKPVSPELVSFLRCLLDKDPTKRLDVVAAMQHPWVTALGAAPLPSMCGHSRAEGAAADLELEEEEAGTRGEQYMEEAGPATVQPRNSGRVLGMAGRAAAPPPLTVAEDRPGEKAATAMVSPGPEAECDKASTAASSWPPSQRTSSGAARCFSPSALSLASVPECAAECLSSMEEAGGGGGGVPSSNSSDRDHGVCCSSLEGAAAVLENDARTAGGGPAGLAAAAAARGPLSTGTAAAAAEQQHHQQPHHLQLHPHPSTSASLQHQQHQQHQHASEVTSRVRAAQHGGSHLAPPLPPPRSMGRSMSLHNRDSPGLAPPPTTLHQHIRMLPHSTGGIGDDLPQAASQPAHGFAAGRQPDGGPAAAVAAAAEAASTQVFRFTGSGLRREDFAWAGTGGGGGMPPPRVPMGPPLAADLEGQQQQAASWVKHSPLQRAHLMRSIKQEEVDAAITRCRPGSAEEVVGMVFEEVRYLPRQQLIAAGDAMVHVYLIAKGEVEMYVAGGTIDEATAAAAAGCDSMLADCTLAAPLISGLDIDGVAWAAVPGESSNSGAFQDEDDVMDFLLPSGSHAQSDSAPMLTELLRMAGPVPGDVSSSFTVARCCGEHHHHTAADARPASAGDTPRASSAAATRRSSHDGAGAGALPFSPLRPPPSPSPSVQPQQELVLAVKGPGDSLGLVGPVPRGSPDSPPTWRASVRAVGEVLALRAEVAGLHRLVQQRPELAAAVHSIAVQHETDHKVAEALRQLHAHQMLHHAQQTQQQAQHAAQQQQQQQAHRQYQHAAAAASAPASDVDMLAGTL